MVEALSNSPDSAPSPPPKGWRKRRDEAGLTTLEWLLIVAAVAGLAALAVVLVQNVVGQTSEQIAGSSARETSALIAAEEIQALSERDADEQPNDADTWGEWETYYTRRCNRLAITYGDAGITVTPLFDFTENASNPLTDDVDGGNVATTPPQNAAPSAAGAGSAVAHCGIS